MNLIGIIAPSSRGDISPADLDVLHARGIATSIHPQTEKKLHQSAGTATERAQAVMDYFVDTKIDAIMATRGGNRAMHILPYLDFKVIKRHYKPLISFSDGTAILNAIYAKTGFAAYHGPTLSRLAKASEAEVAQMLALLDGQPSMITMPNSTIHRHGVATGPMIGGNLSVFTALAGTPYMPAPEGAILFLEDIGDQLSRYDRMLAQLRLAGILERVSGIVFGVMHADGDSSVTPFGFELTDIIREHTEGLDIPIVMDAPFGHKGQLWTMPVGGRAILDTETKAIAIAAR